MVIGEKLRFLREQKNLSQGDIEKRTGLSALLYFSVENGHTVPSVDTLEKMARALEVPMYRLFTDDERVKAPNIPGELTPRRAANPEQERLLRSFAKLFARMDEKSRGLLIHVAAKMANRANDRSVRPIALRPGSFLHEAGFTDPSSVLQREIDSSCGIDFRAAFSAQVGPLFAHRVHEGQSASISFRNSSRRIFSSSSARAREARRCSSWPIFSKAFL